MRPLKIQFANCNNNNAKNAFNVEKESNCLTKEKEF